MASDQLSSYVTHLEENTKLYVLFEHAVGYGLFLIKEFEEIGAFLPQVEAAAKDASKFQKVVQLVAFKPFKNSAAALENINAISEGILTNDLSGFLKANFPALGKNKITLGVSDPKLGASINELLNVPVTHVGAVPEIIRGIRFHLTLFVKALTTVSMKQSELGLGHSYSRGKIKFNVNRVDNMIIQSIALIDQLDKDINTFSMRIREWYSYHFPELAKIVTDNYQYALCANFIKDRSSLSNEESKERLEEILMDSSKAQAVLDSARMTMGMDISPIDLMNIEIFAMKVANLANYRKQLAEYLRNKMNAVAPNLSVLIGEVVGARLISRAGSLMSLAKYPASTVQILGAEKALFRALKTRGKTPKYGLIYHSTYIGRAASTNKGRISRYLANKCSLASRIDCFSELPTSVFGQKLKEQVEERMKFYEVGDLPRKNVDVMAEAVQENEEIIRRLHKEKKKKKKQLKRLEEEVNGSADLTEPIESEEPRKIKKKKKASEPSMLMEEAKEEEAITKKRKKRGSEETTKEKPSKKKKSKVKRE